MLSLCKTACYHFNFLLYERNMYSQMNKTEKITKGLNNKKFTQF